MKVPTGLMGMVPRWWRHGLLAACVAATVGASVASFQAHRPDRPAFLVEAQAEHPTMIKLYFDHGTGFREADSVSPGETCAGGPTVGGVLPCPVVTLRFVLPAGMYSRFRLDAFVPGGRALLSNPRVVADADSESRTLSWGSLDYVDATTSATRVDDGVALVALPGATASQIYIKLDRPLAVLPWPLWRIAWVVFAGIVGGAVTLLATRLSPRRARSMADSPVSERPGGIGVPGQAASGWRVGRLKPVELGRPRPGIAILLATATTIAVSWPSWPGFMSVDSLSAYQQSIDGITVPIWPPMHAYFFWISRHLGGGVLGLYLAQTMLLFFPAALVFTMWLRRLPAALLGFAVFGALFVYSPTMLGTMLVIWKDVATAAFALLGIALWFLAIRAGRFRWLFAAIAAFGISGALRFNALPLLVFILALICVDPFAGRQRRFGRSAATLAVLATLAAAYASDVWRLPDLKRLPDYGFGFSSTQVFDLLGISVCENRSLVPVANGAGGPIAVDVIRQHYDARDVDKAFVPLPGVPDLTGIDDDAIPAAWREVVAHHLGCYLSHRLAVFAWQMGVGGERSFYPTHSGIDENPYGFSLADPQAAADVMNWIWHASEAGWRRPYLLYLAAAGLTALAVLRGAHGGRILMAIMLGALAYPAALFFVGPATDARYIFPSNVFCALLIVLAGSAILRSTRVGARLLGITPGCPASFRPGSLAGSLGIRAAPPAAGDGDL